MKKLFVFALALCTLSAVSNISIAHSPVVKKAAAAAKRLYPATGTTPNGKRTYTVYGGSTPSIIYFYDASGYKGSATFVQKGTFYWEAYPTSAVSGDYTTVAIAVPGSQDFITFSNDNALF
jgi:hypothetical protein